MSARTRILSLEAPVESDVELGDVSRCGAGNWNWFRGLSAILFKLEIFYDEGQYRRYVHFLLVLSTRSHNTHIVNRWDRIRYFVFQSFPFLSFLFFSFFFFAFIVSFLLHLSVLLPSFPFYFLRFSLLNRASLFLEPSVNGCFKSRLYFIGKFSDQRYPVQIK